MFRFLLIPAAVLFLACWAIAYVVEIAREKQIATASLSDFSSVYQTRGEA